MAKDHQPERELEQTQALERDSGRAYRSVRQRLAEICALERYHDKDALKRARITHPAKLDGRKPEEIDQGFNVAIARLWDIATLSQGRADTELRRTYHLVVQGRAPLTEADVIALGSMPGVQLRLLLPWLAHRVSLAEAMERVASSETAPPVIMEEKDIS